LETLKPYNVILHTTLQIRLYITSS